MGITSSVVILCVLLAAKTSSSQLGNSGHPGPVVDLGYAQYMGSTNASTNISSFLGIRYAAAPTGNSTLRHLFSS